MKQAIHIFRKDVRYLRLEISLLLATVAVFTFVAVHDAGSFGGPPSAVTAGLTWLILLFPVAAALLLVRLVQAEPLGGEGPFWAARPYRWSSLLAAKAAFVVAFVNAPKLISDAAIVWGYGLDVFGELPGLFWNQMLLTAMLVLPIAALSAVTNKLVQVFGVCCVLLFVAAGATLMPASIVAGEPWFAMEWTRTYATAGVVAAGAAVIVLSQYARRNQTFVFRMVAAGTVIAALAINAWLPWPLAFAAQSALASRDVDTSEVRVSYEPRARRIWRLPTDPNEDVLVSIPVRVDGLPDDLKLGYAGAEATFVGSNGVRWETSRTPRPTDGTILSLQGPMPLPVYRQLRNGLTRVEGTLYMTLYGDRQSTFIPLSDPGSPVPTRGAGLCLPRMTPGGVLLNCRSFNRPGAEIMSWSFQRSTLQPAPPEYLVPLTDRRAASFSPFPSQAALMPVAQFALRANLLPRYLTDRSVGIAVSALYPVAHVRESFTVESLRLADFEPSDDETLDR